jgi:transposase-like protein
VNQTQRGETVADLHSLSIPEKRRLAQEDLLAGMAPSAVSQKYGVSRGTVSGWHTPEIHSERDRRRSESIAAARAQMAEIIPEAIAALREVANDQAAPQAARVAAAGQLLDRAGAGKIDEITVRVEESSANDIAAGLLAVLGRARGALAAAGAAPAVEPEPDPTTDAEPDPDAE